MALNGQYISFQPIVEKVYRRADYQQIDWAHIIELIGDTIRLIGAKEAYKNVTTNSLNSAPNPLEVQDYRVQLPSDLVVLEGVRKVILIEELNEAGETDLKISSFATMYENTDLYYKSTRNQWNTNIPAGTYDYFEFKQCDKITLSGTTGVASITGAGGLTTAVLFDTDLSTTAANFVSTNNAGYLAEGIVLANESGTDIITFTSEVSGTDFTSPIITNVTGDLSGEVSKGTVSEPVLVKGQAYKVSTEYDYQYKIDDRYIYTNFETGFLELTYKAFVTDEHGLPMIPDDERYINAIMWTIIEDLDYKQWRVGEIPDKVYNDSRQNRDWYVASAKTKSDTPDVAEMESIKNMSTRSITKFNEYSNYFKHSGRQERRWTNNHRNRGY